MLEQNGNVNIKKHSSLSLEMIDIQRDNFGSQLELLIQAIGDKIVSENLTSRKLLTDKCEKEFALIEDLIFRRLGIKIWLITNTTSLGAIMPFYAHNSHIFIKEEHRGKLDLAKDMQKILDENQGKIGLIDLKKAKVSGIFSTYKHLCWLDFYGNFTYLKLTAGEITGVLLHELGHAFTFYEYSDRLSATNQVMANLADALISGNYGKNSIYVQGELNKLPGITKEEVDFIASSSRMIASFKVLKKYVDQVSSLLPNSKYDETTAEQLADNFATRFGYGRQLITALDKASAGSPEKNKTTRILTYLFADLSIITTPAMIMSALLPISIPLAVIAALFIGALLIYSAGDSVKDMTYDILRQRYVRVRQQYIAMTKELDIPKPELAKIIANIEAIDAIIDDTKKFTTLLNKLSNILFTKNRNLKDDVELQGLIESLAHNDLFLMSAKLSTSA